MWLLVVIAILPLSKCARCQHNYCDPEDATEWYDKYAKYTLKYELWFVELWEGWALKSDFKLIFTLRWVSESDTVEKFIFV